jgi:hypothetical protein
VGVHGGVFPAMSGSNWGGRIALGVGYLALLGIIFSAGYWLVENNYAELHRSYSTYQATAEHDRRATADEISRSCFKSDFTEFSECIAQKIKTYYQQQATNQDLQAQQDMAFWAKALFILGIGQAVLTGLGLLYVWYNLQISREGVKTALQANEVNREVGEAQARAYLTVTKTEIWYDPKSLKPYLTFHIRNSGQSPAFNLLVAYKVRPPEEFAASPSDERVTQYPIANQLAANTEDDFTVLVPRGAAQPNEKDPGSVALFLHLEGMIEYQTVFGVVRKEVSRDCVFSFIHRLQQHFHQF